MFYAPYVPRFPLCNIYCCSILKHVSLKGVVVTSTGGVGEYPKMNCISQHTRGKPHCAGLTISKHRDGLKAHICAREKRACCCEICFETQTSTYANWLSGRLSCAAKERGHKQKHVARAVRKRVCDHLNIGQIVGWCRAEGELVLLYSWCDIFSKSSNSSDFSW